MWEEQGANYLPYHWIGRWREKILLTFSLVVAIENARLLQRINHKEEKKTPLEEQWREPLKAHEKTCCSGTEKRNARPKFFFFSDER